MSSVKGPCTCIEHLPDELLDLIFDYHSPTSCSSHDLWDRTTSFTIDPDHASFFVSSSQLKTLTAICSTSKRFNRIATPILYRAVRSASDLTTLPNGLSLPVPSIELARTLISRPALALNIRTLITAPMNASRVWMHPQPTFESWFMQLDALLDGRIPQLEEQQRQWLRHLANKRYDHGFTAAHILVRYIILALAKNLDGFAWADCNELGESPQLLRLLHQCGQSQLRHLRLQTYSSRFKPLQANFLDAMPRLCTLIMDMPREFPPIATELRVTQPHNLRDLRVNLVRAKDLEWAIKPWTSLERLEIRFGSASIVDRLPSEDPTRARRDFANPADWDVVAQVLRRHSSLHGVVKHVTLDCFAEPHIPRLAFNSLAAYHWPRPLSHIVFLRALETLCIHQSAFVRFDDANPIPQVRRPLVDVLPTGLKRLQITCFDSVLYSQMEHFAASGHLTHPLLKTIEVVQGDFCYYDTNRAYPPHNLVRSSEDQLESLYQKFSAAGVEFSEIA